eukprot:1159783-Pelagomonas_calceolata.AAC.20
MDLDGVFFQDPLNKSLTGSVSRIGQQLAAQRHGINVLASAHGPANSFAVYLHSSNQPPLDV